MRVARNLRLSLRALQTHRARTLLAVGGTATGVAGVLLIGAIAAGARTAALQRVEQLGAHALLVTAEKREARAGRVIQSRNRVNTLTSSDAQAILYSSAPVVRAAPAQDGELRAKYGPIITAATVIGTTPEWLHIRRFAIERGRFFTAAEDELRRRVAVIGADVRDALFADTIDPVGRELRIQRVPFVVIGVLERKGISVDGNATEDDRIIIPLQTALRRVFDVDYVKQIHLELAPGADVERAEHDVADILRARHALERGGADDFTIENQRRAVEATFATRTTFARMGRTLVLLTLLLGGSGILSNMMLSVRERRAEIGLRVAIGARRADILTQFLAEALLLAAVGGAAGILLGSTVALIVSSATSWDSVISAGTLGTAVLVSVAMGAVFGGLPAWRAATLDPIASLRAS